MASAVNRSVSDKEMNVFIQDAREFGLSPVFKDGKFADIKLDGYSYVDFDNFIKVNNRLNTLDKLKEQQWQLAQ